MSDHLSLVVMDIRKCDAEQFMVGNFQSVGLGDTVSRLRKISNVEIGSSAEKCFESLRKHRNKMVHFYHGADLRTKEGKALKDQIIKEQCAGWFFLRRLLQDSWQEEFGRFGHKINVINGQMKRHTAYLETVYEKVKPELDSEVKNGATLGYCYSCGYDAHVIDETGPFEGQCRVCTAYGSFLRHQCEHCDTLFLIEDGFEGEQQCPECEAPVTLGDLMQCYSEEGAMSDKDRHVDGGYGNCAECTGLHTVGTVSDSESFCFCCHQFQEPMGVCGYCGEKATGDLEYSYSIGCVVCDGSFG